jgi:hypothetical protein
MKKMLHSLPEETKHKLMSLCQKAKHFEGKLRALLKRRYEEQQIEYE